MSRRQDGSPGRYPPLPEPIRRWESGARAHGVNDPFDQGPLPWLRGAEQYLEDGSRVLPWYVDLGPTGELPSHAARSLTEIPAQRRAPPPTDAAGRATGDLRSANDVGCQIKGYAATGSVLPGGAIDFKISVNPPQEFNVDIYRIGHYGGDGARHILGGPGLIGITQPEPMIAGRTVSCHHWWMTWRLQVPEHWRPGAYVAVLTNRDRFRSHIPFTVREERPSDLLVVLPNITWQAYNLYPENGRTGASLYHAWDDRGGLLGGSEAAGTVSFDRPYAGSGLPMHVGHAYDFVRWAERYGYDLGYADATDLHAGRVDASRHLGLVFPGHDEYWSAPMRQAAERARNAGTSLVFLSANTMYWQVTVDAAPSGEPDRLVSCRKHPGSGGGRSGGGRPSLWRKVGEPEQQLMGVQYQGRVPEPGPLVVRNAGHWLWEGTGLREEDEVEDLVAGEADRYFPRVPLPECTERTLLAHSPYRSSTGAERFQETSLYRAPSGALVFASGTFAWSPALDRPRHTDTRVQRATANLLDRICKRG